MMRKKVIVIGGGLADLCAAFELQGLGRYDAVYEARDQVGGRVQTSLDFATGRLAEGGGESIGSNHPVARQNSGRL